MKTRLFASLLALSLFSCDKAKELANKASSAMKDQIAAKVGAPESAQPDPELQKLVDQTPEGVVFRKDLPFPARLDVKTTRRREISGRLLQSSAIQKSAETIKGTQVTVTRLERASDQVRYTLEQSSFTTPSAEDPNGEPRKIADPLAQIAPATQPITFRKSGNSWATDQRDGFHAAVLAKQLAPVLDDLLIENAIAPRSLWFSKHRLKVGDELDVSTDSLPMLLAGRGKGTFHLKLEAIEPVNGHPCGVFSVTGDYSRKQFPDFDGNLTDEDVSIESGKLWLSLLHPIILKEELDTVQTFRSGGQGGLTGRGQGTVKVSITRDWKLLAPSIR